jgi:hypothetical protein
MERHPGDQNTEVLPALEIFSVGQHHGEYFSETDLDRMAEASLAEGCFPQVAAVPIEAIDRRVGDWDATLLKELESRHGIPVERDRLPVEQQGPGPQLSDDLGDVWEGSTAILRVARLEGHVRSLLVGQDALPIVLLLVHPRGTMKRLAHEGCQHRMDPEGNALTLSQGGEPGLHSPRA